MSDRTERSLNFLTDFLTLQPLFTRSGLRIVWYLYLLYQSLVFLGAMLSFRWAPGHPLSTWYSLAAFALIPLVKIAVLRLLLEVAGIVLTRHSERFRDAG